MLWSVMQKVKKMNRAQSIESRLEALEARAAAFTERQDPDPLSRSLYEFSEELRTLDEQGIADYAAALGTTPEIIRAMVQDAKKAKRNIFERKF